MQEWQAITTGAAVAVAVASLLVLVGQRTRRDAEIVFAVVSGSMALSLMSPWMDGAPAWMRWAVAIGGSATCNGFWLVSRALFRGDGENTRKLSAAWLIDQCGWKGKALGPAAVHDKQALVLVNLGGAKGSDILALSDAVRASVHEKFGIDIHPEVNLIN